MATRRAVLPMPQPESPPRAIDWGALLIALGPALNQVADELADRIADRWKPGGDSRPPLLNRSELAHHLDVSVDTVDRLRREGCPELMVGDSPRYELDRVLEWLRNKR